MSDEMIQQQIDAHAGKLSTLERELAVASNEIAAIKARTDRMMQESVDGRAEIRKEFKLVTNKLQQVHDYQVAHQSAEAADKENEAKNAGSRWGEKLYKAFIPVMLTIILIAIAAKGAELI